MARPTKYNDEVVAKICELILDGFCCEEAAEKAGISKPTLYDWKKRFPEFSEAIKVAEQARDQSKVPTLVKSLFKRAAGYDIEEMDTIMIPDSKGKPMVKMQKSKKKHIPADIKAAIFLLTNLAPERWKDKQQNELTGTLTNKVTIEYVDSGIELAHSEDEITD